MHEAGCFFAVVLFLFYFLPKNPLLFQPNSFLCFRRHFCQGLKQDNYVRGFMQKIRWYLWKAVTWREKHWSRKRVSSLLVSDLDSGLSLGVSLGTGSIAERNNIMYLGKLALGNNSLQISKICLSGRQTI